MRSETSDSEAESPGVFDAVSLRLYNNALPHRLLCCFHFNSEMGAGGAYELSPITKHMAQRAGGDFKRNNPVRVEDRCLRPQRDADACEICQHHWFVTENRQVQDA